MCTRMCVYVLPHICMYIYIYARTSIFIRINIYTCTDTFYTCHLFIRIILLTLLYPLYGNALVRMISPEQYINNI